MLFWAVRSVHDSGLYMIDECGCIVGRHCWILIISVELRCQAVIGFLLKSKNAELLNPILCKNRKRFLSSFCMDSNSDYIWLAVK